MNNKHIRGGHISWNGDFRDNKVKKAYLDPGRGSGDRPVLARTGMGKFDFRIGRVKEGWDMNNKHIRGGHISWDGDFRDNKVKKANLDPLGGAR